MSTSKIGALFKKINTKSLFVLTACDMFFYGMETKTIQ